MPETGSKSQRNTVLTVVLLVAIAIAGYSIVTSFLKQRAAKPERTVAPTPGTPGARAAMARPGMAAGPGLGCPASELSGLLGAEIVHGHVTSASGPGVGITTVVPGGAAANAGLKDGDVILSVDGTPVDCPTTALGLIRTANTRAAADEKTDGGAALKLDRKGKVIQITLGGGPSHASPEADQAGTRSQSAPPKPELEPSESPRTR